MAAIRPRLSRLIPGLVCLGLGVGASLHAEPVVSNLVAEQIPGEHKVRLTFDLEDLDGQSTPLRVEWKASDDQDYAPVPAAALPAGFGDSVAPASGIEVEVNVGEIAGLKGLFSREVRFKVATGGGGGGAVPAGFVEIPGGSFEMGDSFNEGGSWERPVHTVEVSGFYMQSTEVSKAQWDEVATWAAANGYDISASSASGKGADHPAHSVTWYECVKWCNARTEWENANTGSSLTPCYTVGGATYKTDNSAPDCNFGANGYRLPTEAEWEKAARGGLSGKRFPWGDTINHSHANYSAYGSAYSYDTSPYTTWTYHPTYNDGVFPYTSSVGSFAPNGYGLYDMAGNLWEWCNDWYGSSYYSSSPASDPTGPAAVSYRVLRGGSWDYYASICRVANRGADDPDCGISSLGFRPVRR